MSKNLLIDNRTNVWYNNSRIATWSYYIFCQTEPVNIIPILEVEVNHYEWRSESSKTGML